MLGLFQLLALGLILAIAIATGAVVHRLRNPPRRTYAWALSRGVPGDPSELDRARGFTPFEVMAGGARCAAWEIPGDAPNGALVVCTPGWGDSKLGVLARLDAILPHASRVIAWDPPGLGDTPGRCPLGTREPGMLLEIVREIREQGRPTVLAGWSLGAGVSIAAGAIDSMGAPDEPPLVDAVVAEAPYRHAWTPAFAVIRAARMPWRINGPLAFALMGIGLTGHPLWRGFDRAIHAARCRRPTLVLHGTEDDVSPFADSGSIAAAAPDATLVPVAGAGHNNLWTEEPHRSACADALGDFLASFAMPIATIAHPGVH